MAFQEYSWFGWRILAKRNEHLAKLLHGVANMNLGDVKEHDIDAFGDAYESRMLSPNPSLP